MDQGIHMTFEAGCREFFYARNSRCNREIRRTLNRKMEFTPKEYLYRIYYYHALVERIEGVSSSGRLPVTRKLGYRRELTLSALVVLLSALLFAHHWVPEKEPLSLVFGLQLGSYGFRDTSTFLFCASNKLVLFTLGLLWFATCRYWWRWAILAPVLFYLYQFWEVFQPVQEIDGSGNLNVVPLALLTVLVVILLGVLIRRHSITRDYQHFLKQELDKGLEQFSQKEARQRLKQIQVYNPEVL